MRFGAVQGALPFLYLSRPSEQVCEGDIKGIKNAAEVRYWRQEHCLCRQENNIPGLSIPQASSATKNQTLLSAPGHCPWVKGEGFRKLSPILSVALTFYGSVTGMNIEPLGVTFLTLILH